MAINREAGDLYKALRLQKLRAIIYILEYIELNPNKDIAVAVEILEDVYVRTEDSQTFEQDKDYDPNSTFTINSEEILKSLCSFLDIWIHNQLSSKISFCFLTTNNYSKERTSKLSKEAKIVFPVTKILEELSSLQNERIKNVVVIVKKIITLYYKENYPLETQNIDIIENLDDDLWVDFFTQIKWIFGYQNIEETESDVLAKIKNCYYYNHYGSSGREEQIKTNLIDLIEKKTYKADKIFKLLVLSDVKLQFAENNNLNPNLNEDSVYKLWKTIDKPNDTRNLREKILSVCPNFDKKKLESLERQASIAKVEEETLKNSPKYLSLKFRVYNFCENNLNDILKSEESREFSFEELMIIINKINNECVNEFEVLKVDYDYGIKRNSIILELFIEFIDSCYLAFD